MKPNKELSELYAQQILSEGTFGGNANAGDDGQPKIFSIAYLGYDGPDEIFSFRYGTLDEVSKEFPENVVRAFDPRSVHKALKNYKSKLDYYQKLYTTLKEANAADTSNINT